VREVPSERDYDPNRTYKPIYSSRTSGFAFTSVLKCVGRCKAISSQAKVLLADHVLSLMETQGVEMNDRIYHQLTRYLFYSLLL